MARIPEKCKRFHGEEMENCVRREIAERCEGAGNTFEHMVTQYNLRTIAPVNLTGIVPERDFYAPYSELCMHVGCAGKRLIDMAMSKDGRAGAIVFQRDDGTCGYTDGLATEVMNPDLVRTIKHHFHIED